MTTNNTLLKNAFDDSLWKNQEKLDYLKSIIDSTERRIENHLAQISTDFSQLTDHSLKHSRKLWDYANIIIGSNDPKYINPLEAFILHLSFLIHDSGMCCSILNNINDVHNDPLYLDYIKQHGDTETTKQDALFFVIRVRHGEYALRIATQQWKNREYLIDDNSLREELGVFIGKIAQSHTENINYIEREFGPNYCSPNFPSEWSVDCIKLSFILRVADAAHIDNLRTPKSRKLILEIPGISKEHWTFQKKLGFPTFENNLLVYTSNTPFSEEEQKAWWLCHEALLILDKELKIANEFFENKKVQGFAAKGVKSVNNTLELGKNYIRTSGWDSIDTTIRVSNPIHIATELGGIRLYGNKNIALRELIQNSIDAINLHRVYTEQKDNTNVGEIKVAIEKESNDFFLVVTDNGIGMSQSLLTNELLDFGGSYWRSNRFKYDFEGAKHNGFESIGKFGIGFFSVFMLGQKITVTSWKYGESISNMKTLDFFDGITSNPILRSPTDAEKNRIVDRGTSIKIKLNDDPYSNAGLIGSSNYKDKRLFSLVKFFCPSPNVKIVVTELDKSSNSIEANGMYNLSFGDLSDYLYLPQTNHFPEEYPIEIVKSLGIDLIEIMDDKKLLGKLALLPNLSFYVPNSFAVVLSNGIRVKELNSFCGYIHTNDIVSLKRDVFTKLISFENLKVWAKKQKEMIEQRNLQSLYGINYFSLLVAFGMHDENMPILRQKINNQYCYVTVKAFKDILNSKSEIKIHTENHRNTQENCDGFIRLNHNLSFNEILKEEDIDNLGTFDSVIKDTIKSIWGETYQEIPDNRFMQNPFAAFNAPYVSITTYKRNS